MFNHEKGDDHGNDHDHGHDVDSSVKGRLALAVVLTSVIFVAEAVGGYLFNSLALLSDAAHVLMDVLALAMSLFAIHISAMPPTEKKTFGLHRAEVLVSFLNGVTLLFVSLYIFYKAFVRVFEPQPVESTGMLIIAVIGLVVNVIVAFWLQSYAKHDLNVKSAFYHVVGDAVASAGVIIAAVIIHYTGWYFADTAISVVIGFIIIGGASRIVEESVHILLEGVPAEIELPDVVAAVKSVDGVEGVHSVHIWSICHNLYSMSAHVELDRAAGEGGGGDALGEINELLAERFHIFYTTLQVECAECETGSVLRNMTHRGGDHSGHSH